MKIKDVNLVIHKSASALIKLLNFLGNLKKKKERESFPMFFENSPK